MYFPGSSFARTQQKVNVKRFQWAIVVLIAIQWILFRLSISRPTLSPDLCSLVEQLLWEEDDYRNNRKRFRNPGKVKGLRNYMVGIYSISDCRDGFCFEAGLFSIEYIVTILFSLRHCLTGLHLHKLLPLCKPVLVQSSCSPLNNL